MKALIIALVVVGFLLRIYPGLHDIIFPYDQARDVLLFKTMIARKHPALLGPVTDITGVHHGPLYYNLFAPIYAMSNWDPWLPLLAMIIINLSTLFPLYLLIYDMTSDKRTSLIALTLFAVSFEMVSYSRWLSNPPLAIPLMAWFLLLLWKTSQGKRTSSFLLGLLLGLLVQTEVVLAYLLIPCYVFLWKGKAKLKQWTLFHFGGLLGASTFFIAELKFNFQATKALFAFFHQTASGNAVALIMPFQRALSIYTRLLRGNGLGFPQFIAIGVFLIIIALLLYATRKASHRLHTSTRFLLAMLGFSLLTFVFGKSPEIFFFVGIGLIPLILLSFFLSHIFRHGSALLATTLLGVVIISQLVLIYQQARGNKAYIQVQDGVLFRQRMEVLDAVYARIPRGVPFSVSILETPYGIRAAWAYYFSYYQERNTTVLPSWYGFAANGYLGDEVLPHTDVPASIHITIYEPEFSIMQKVADAFRLYQEEHTSLVDSFEINNHRVEIRQPL